MKVRRNTADWLTKPAVLQNNLQAQYLKNAVIIWNKSEERDIKLKTEKNFDGDVNISADVVYGEIKDGKKNKVTISDIPFFL